MLIERTYFYQNFFKASSVLNKLRFCEKFLRVEISLAHPFRWSRNWQAQIIYEVMRHSGIETRDYMHACPFRRISSVVASNYNSSFRHVVLFNSCSSFWIGRNISRTPHLFSCILSHVYRTLRYISLIYVTAPLFPRGFWEKTKTNGVPKWRENVNVSKTS